MELISKVEVKANSDTCHKLHERPYELTVFFFSNLIRVHIPGSKNHIHTSHFINAYITRGVLSQAAVANRHSSMHLWAKLLDECDHLVKAPLIKYVFSDAQQVTPVTGLGATIVFGPEAAYV